MSDLLSRREALVWLGGLVAVGCGSIPAQDTAPADDPCICSALGLGLGFGSGGHITPPPPVVSGIFPSYGSESGGTVVWIQTTNAAIVTGATIGGVAVTGLEVVSPTMVRATTGAHAVGLANVVLQSLPGDSAPLVDGFQYFDPTDANYSPSVAYVAPNYDDVLNNESFYPSAGTALVCGTTPIPTAVGGSPSWDGATTAQLHGSDPASTWYGTGDRHVVAVVSLAGIANDDTGNVYGNNAIFYDSNAVLGLTIYRTGAGPYTYWAEIFEYDSGFRKASLDISSLCDAVGGSLSTLVIEAKKESGILMIRANGGGWISGDACGALSITTGTLQMGRGYGGGRINGTVRALVVTPSAQSAGYSAAVVEWGTRIPGGWVRRLAYTMPTSPNEFYVRNSPCTFRLASGRLLIVGGFNGQGLAAWGSMLATNEVWASDDDGATWSRLLAHDASPPSTGAGARFGPLHSVAHGTCQGVAVICGSDPSFSTAAQAKEVWVSDSTGAVWTRVNADAPWGTNYEANLGVIGNDIYYMGGQTATLDSSTRVKHVYKSSDLGANWTTLADAPWPTGRGCMWSMPTLNGEIYVIGGATYDQTTPLTYNGVYAFDGSTWRTVLADGHGQWSAYLFSTAVALHGRLYLMNGSIGVADQYRLLSSDDLGQTWVDQNVGAGATSSTADIALTTDSLILRIPGLTTGSPLGKNVYSFGLE